MALIASSNACVLYSTQDPCMTQVAAYIGDAMLLDEGAVRFHNCAAPLLAAKANHDMLRKALAACHVALTEAKASNDASIQVRMKMYKTDTVLQRQRKSTKVQLVFTPFESLCTRLVISNMLDASYVPRAGVPEQVPALSDRVSLTEIVRTCCIAVGTAGSNRQQMLVRIVCRAQVKTRKLHARCLQQWHTTCSMLALLTSKLRPPCGWSS